MMDLLKALKKERDREGLLMYPLDLVRNRFLGIVFVDCGVEVADGLCSRQFLIRGLGPMEI